MGVSIPPTLAPYAIESAKRSFKPTSLVIKSAIDISMSVVVVFERIELKSADVSARENIIARGVLGKKLNILSATQICKFVFSTAIASKNPPKKRKIIGFE